MTADILYSLFNLYWVAGRWADLVSVGIPPSCPQCNPEGCCKTRAVLQTVSIRSNNSGKFSLHCPGSPGETETHKVNLRLTLGKCCICEVVFLCVPAGRARRPPETGTPAWTLFLYASGPTGTSRQSGCSSEWLDRILTKGIITVMEKLQCVFIQKEVWSWCWCSALLKGI